MATATSDLNAAIAVTRFGLGTRPGEIAQAAPDPHGWLKAQICHEGADQPQTPLGAPFPDSRALSANVIAYDNALKLKCFIRNEFRSFLSVIH